MFISLSLYPLFNSPILIYMDEFLMILMVGHQGMWKKLHVSFKMGELLKLFEARETSENIVVAQNI